MKILVFQHLAVEHPGSLRDVMTGRGIQWATVELDEGDPVPSLEPFDALVVMGGPMDVWQEDRFPWLAAEKQAIRRWVRELNRPYLGVCLGHQLLAAALGGEVALAARPEVGILPVHLLPSAASDPLLAGVASPAEALQWHGAEVARAPEGSVVLARSGDCEIQAMRINRAAYGFQYHVEATASTVAEWAAIPEYAASLDAAMGPGAAAKLDAAVADKIGAFNAAARQMFERFLALVEARE